MEQMGRIEHCQTVLPSVVLAKLKEVTNESVTKEALRIAVEHTIKTYNIFSEEEINYILSSKNQIRELLKAKLLALLPEKKVK